MYFQTSQTRVGASTLSVKCVKPREPNPDPSNPPGHSCLPAHPCCSLPRPVRASGGRILLNHKKPLINRGSTSSALTQRTVLGRTEKLMHALQSASNASSIFFPRETCLHMICVLHCRGPTELLDLHSISVNPRPLHLPAVPTLHVFAVYVAPDRTLRVGAYRSRIW